MGKETISKTTFAKGLTAGVVVAASLGLLSVGEYKLGGNASYTPGTYTSYAKGIESDVVVTVTFDEKSITSVEADVSGETAGLGADAGDALIEQAMAAQSASIDGVSGVTVTSDAFRQALASCIAQATGQAPIETPPTEEAAEETEAAAEAASGAASDETEAATEEATEVATEEATEAVTEEATEAVTEEAAEAVAASTLTPGTYTASAAGISSDVVVTATFDENGITEITADVSGETAGLGADAGDSLIEEAMNAQSADIDAISGVTITSNAFKAALADCIAQAAGGEAAEAATEENTEAVTEEATEAATEEATEEATEAVTEEDTEAATEEATEEATEAVTEEATEAVTEEATEAATEEAAGAADGSALTPGTYTASAAGISSDVTVTVTFDENGISEITADVSGETAGIGAAAGEPLVKKAMDAQSAEIDGVAGATITSDAFKAALADCMEQAGYTADAAEAETEEATEAADSEEDTVIPAPDAPFIPGTYTATAKGIGGDITVTVTFDENNILAVGLALGCETPDIGGAAGDTLSAQILEVQSAEIDGVSGATITSDAVITATTDCIAQACAWEDETDMEAQTETQAADEAGTEAQTDAESESETEA